MNEVSLSDFTASPAFDVDEIDRLLSRYGAVVIPGWVQEPLLSQLRHDWESVRSERNDPNSVRVQRLGGATADYAGLYRSASGGKAFPAVEQVFNAPLMVDLCDRFIGKPSLFNEEIYMTFDSGRGEEVAPSHFDKTYNIKFFIYLHDILESRRGAFSVHPGSQALARKQFRKWFAANGNGEQVEIGTDAFYEMGNETLPDELPPCVEILAPAGTLIVFNTDVFHRGGMLAPGHERRVVRGHCYPGYRLPRTGDMIRKNSRQWIRGENWETNRRRYSRFSLDGYNEWKEYMGVSAAGLAQGLKERFLNPVVDLKNRALAPIYWLARNPSLLVKPSFYKKVALKLFRAH